jgi:hypothetical protein
MAEWVLTEQMLAEWHDELNALCFDYQLPRTTFVVGYSRDADWKDRTAYMALYLPDCEGKGTILLNPDYVKDEHGAKAMLAHEMIHQWQDLCALRLDHFAIFRAWAEHITNLTGLVP